MTKNVEMKLLLTAEEAKTWMNENNIYADLEKCGVELNDAIIDRLYKTAEFLNQSCPIVAHYHNTHKGFVFRKWVGVTCDTFIGFDMNEKCSHYKGLHNTQLKDKFMPNATDEEYCIAFQWNKKLGVTDDNENIWMVTDKYAEPGNKQQQIIDYCNNLNLLEVDWEKVGYTSGLNNIGTLRKLPFRDKATDYWKTTGEFVKAPNFTPKTDLVASTGERISLKKKGGSQLISAARNEAIATISVGLREVKLDDAHRNRIYELFEQFPPVNTPECEERIAYCNQIINEFIHTNRELKKAIIKEALTGANKFGVESLSSATHVYVFDVFNKSTLYTCDEYVEKIVDDARFYFAYKSHSGENDRYVSFRINTK